ncbi:Hypothetical predicted protein, partial [Marmota monax]
MMALAFSGLSERLHGHKKMHKKIPKHVTELIVTVCPLRPVCCKVHRIEQFLTSTTKSPFSTMKT